MGVNENIDLRLTLIPEDPLYHPYKNIKESLGIRSHSEVIRFIIKQVSNIPISKLMEENLRSIKKVKSTKKEVKKT